MSAYLAAVVADAPRHYWRCADPGGLLLHDIGAVPRHMRIGPNFGLSGYSGPNSDGGSALCTNLGPHAYYDQELRAAPISLEVLVWIHYSTGLPCQPLSVTDGAGVGWVFRIRANYSVDIFGPGGTVNSAAIVLTNQTWAHLVLTDTGAAMILYINGVNRGAAGGAGAANPNVAYWLNGYWAAGGYSGNLNVAEAAVYPAALSAARVLAHYNAIDQLATSPVASAAGGTSGGGTGSTAYQGLEQQILASVRKSY